MRRLFLLSIAAGALLQSASAASAANVTSWVASTGGDANACTRSQPCATFAGALAKTVDGGVILCADSGSFGTPGAGLTISQGIEIDCRGQSAIIEITGTTGVVIAVSDPVNQSVTIRGVVINGRLGAGARANTAGISIQAARTVALSHVLVEQFAQQGLIDTRSLQANTTLLLTSSSFAGNTGPGIVAAMTPNNFNSSVVLHDVFSGYNSYGIAVANGNRVRITHSNFPYNAIGVEADTGGQIAISQSVIAYCATAAFQNSGTIVAGENEITYVATVFSGGGLTYTNGNNRINFYTSLGTPTSLPTSTDRGQQ
jgi:hypothetical protein